MVAGSSFRTQVTREGGIHEWLPSITFRADIMDAPKKPTRSRSQHSEENLNSPVNDPGYWPYPRLSGGLQETVTSLDEPDDPLGLVPHYDSTLNEDEGDW